MNYLSEAFKRLETLDEDVFNLTKDGLEDLKDFEEDSDDEEETIEVVDPDAESKEDLKDSYIGKVILDCEVCHTDIYKDKEDIKIDEETQLANVGEECPYCFSSEGFKVIGEVKPFVETTFETDDNVEVKVDDEEVEEDEDDEKNESLKKYKKITEDLSNDWEFIEYDGRGPSVPDAYFSYPNGDDDLQLVIYPPQEFNGKYYDMWGAEVNSESNGSIDDYKDGFSSFEEAEAWINSKLKNLGESLKESISRRNRRLKESCSINQCQKWVDYDMKKYKKISDDTMEKIKSSGYSVVKDQYGDYEVIADRKDTSKNEACGEKRKSRKMKESIEDITIDTGDQEITVSAVDKEEVESDDEMIEPVSDEIQDEIEMNSEETEENANDESTEDVDVDIDEVSEEDIDKLGESYLKKVYENVDSYKTTSAKIKENKLYLEGLIKFNSGKEKKTTFVFESRTLDKNNRAKFIGENLQISRGHKSFKLTGKLENNRFIAESLNYNYRTKDDFGKSTRVYGTVKVK